VNRPLPLGRQHVAELMRVLPSLDTDRLTAWGQHLAQVLPAGARLLVAGNGGSAAEAQHLTAELVGRLRDDRPPLSAIALHAETSSLTAIANDYGYDEAFARQVRGHGRAGDVLLLLSTSGRSPSVVRAAQDARELGIRTWALTGPMPSPLTLACDEAVAVDSAHVATIQEAHLVAVHLIASACDVALGVAPAAGQAADTGLPAPAAGSSVAPVAVGGAGAAPRRVRAPLVVVGDTLLDRDLVGRVERLSPDAPVPVVDDLTDRPRPGGAGLAAVLAARDGRAVTLVTALASDAGSDELRLLLEGAGVRVVDLGLDGTTPEKIRVRAAGRSLVRLDRGGAGGGGAGAVGPLTPEAAAALEQAQAVLVADYGRGVAAEPGVRRMLTRLAGLPRRLPVVWDPHPRGPEPVAGCRLVTPNTGELQHFASLAGLDVAAGQGGQAGQGGDGTCDEIARATTGARALVQRWSASAVAVTRGEHGALLAGDADTPPLLVPAPPAPLSDPCGAGDRFASAAAGLLADGGLPSEAVQAAVVAASTFVAAGGAAAVDVRGSSAAAAANDLDAGLTPPPTAAEVAERTRAAGGTVVATGGCFDLLHAGHVGVLQQARALGDCLVVLLNSDDSVRRLKGADRPLVPATDRAAVLLALGCVDAVLEFDEDTPADALRELRPHVWAKGGDYAVADLPEAPALAGWGGQAVVLPYLSGRSTTSLIQEAVRRGR